MLKIKEKLEFDEELKKKIEYICNTTPTIINSNIQNIDKTNITYIENYRIIIKKTTFLAFNYSNTLLDNLSNKIELKDLENFIKQLNYVKILTSNSSLLD